MKPTLLVLAAGMGSRYGGVKQIDGVGLHNEALLDYSVYDAMMSDFGKVVFVIRKDIEHDFRERLFDRIARNFDASYTFQSLQSLLTPQQVSQSAQRRKPWTFIAILCAKEMLNEPFCVTTPMIITGDRHIRLWESICLKLTQTQVNMRWSVMCCAIRRVRADLYHEQSVR